MYFLREFVGDLRIDQAMHNQRMDNVIEAILFLMKDSHYFQTRMLSNKASQCILVSQSQNQHPQLLIRITIQGCMIEH